MEITIEAVENPVTPGKTPVKKGIVLILEDQRGFRKIYRDVLEQDGYEVLEGTNGDRKSVV